ncbi:unnamed protein product [Eruca vesicaria subsp. sativa]|uniref:Legume lectin domain-containing protein n=1 Tax=Eruca vesicaria subsp. sativa TaxID=29727 RepID=A0ABC8L856_ERUVS|nr:unnamed protein product [Eruca vesicaria subsp. sativa]
MAKSILFIFFLLPFVVDSLYFNITSFQPGDNNIEYHGDAEPDGDGTVNFNSARLPSQVGWITYSKDVPIWSPSTGNASDFNTSFSFRIDVRNLSSDSHGLCFFLAPVGAQLPAYTPSGFLGLFGQDNDYKSSFDLVHIEFDTFRDPWDPRDVASHVGINNNSLASSNYTSWNASLHSQDIGHAHVTYDSVNKNLSVSWGYELTRSAKENSSLSYIIDLAKVLPSEVMLGFIAAAGANTGEHRLLSWELSSSLEPEKADNKTGLIIGIAVAGFVLLTLLVAVMVWWRKRKNSREITNMVLSSSINEDLEKETGGPRKFSYKDLVSATNGFSHQRKLGQGGCASKESDMYSFGIVLLEIVTGRKSLERQANSDDDDDDDDSESDEKSLVEKVWELYGRREELLSSGVDEKLGDDFNMEEAECLLVLGLWCGHPDKSARPSIKQAIQVMKLESPLPVDLPLKRPVATYYNSTSSSSPPSVNSSRASITFSSKEIGR